MQKKKIKNISEYVDLQVKLKPVLGIKPGIYLSVLYLIIILTVLFFILVFPGLKDRGSRVYFVSEPDNSSVWINSIYAGTTPFAAFIPEGYHEITYRKPGFIESGEVFEIESYIFGSIFKKPELTIEKKLELSSHRELYEWALEDIIRWGMIEDYHSAYQPEKLISKTIESLHDCGNSSPLTEKFLLLSLKNVNREYFLGDFIRAYMSFASSGPAVLPGNIIDAVSEAAVYASKNRYVLFHLLRLAGKDAELIFRKFNYQQFLSDFFYQEDKALLQPAGDSGGNYISIAGKPYKHILSGKYHIGNPDYIYSPEISSYQESVPFYKELSSFYISSEMVTNREYYDFVSENSFWDKSNSDELINKKLVTKDYLNDWTGGEPSSSLMNLPVRFVSFYSAEAYCEWMNSKKSDRFLPDYQYILPDEYMREAADSGSTALPSAALWEWCSNWFNEADYIDSAVIPDNPLKGIEKSVRLGSLTNVSSGVFKWTRGSQPPFWCTPFTGFRIALAEK